MHNFTLEGHWHKKKNLALQIETKEKNNFTIVDGDGVNANIFLLLVMGTLIYVFL